jgi:hypothetical protein
MPKNFENVRKNIEKCQKIFDVFQKGLKIPNCENGQNVTKI